MSDNTSARMPSGIPFIIVNEFAERFCYYGINAILALYLVQYMRFGEAEATTWGSLFKSGSYFFPLLGAVVSDVFWGKFRTVLTFSAFYCVGCVVLALAREPTFIALGLFLVAFGTGGIKPCVATNVGDQFTQANQHLIERAFSWFYLAVNAGSMISIWFCPKLLPAYGPTAAFGLPAIMMFVAIVAFWAGRTQIRGRSTGGPRVVGGDLFAARPPDRGAPAEHLCVHRVFLGTLGPKQRHDLVAAGALGLDGQGHRPGHYSAAGPGAVRQRGLHRCAGAAV